MKNLAIILIVAIAILSLDCGNSSIDTSQMVNPILGDISYEIKFGHKPNGDTNNDLRVKTHLEYVENLLRQKDVSNIPLALQTRRKHILDLFHDYWMNGVFPKNYDYSDQRKPCFIDKDNNICAVGYLVEQTVNRQVANKINASHKYDEVLAMNDEIVDDWISTSGLTKKEVAMIQPSYGPQPVDNYNFISPVYGVSSALIGGLNISLTTMNGIQIRSGYTDKFVGKFGMVSGGVQVAMGLISIPKQDNNGFTRIEANESKKVLSLINIGIGTSTFVLSYLNLRANDKRNKKLNSWNIYSVPIDNNKNGVALSFTRKF